MSLEILTGCFSHYRPKHGIAVRISLGKPKWFPNEGRDLPFVKALAPAPWYFDEPDDDTFRRRYRHQLHRWTPQRVLAELQGIAVAADCPRLVLCCFEADPMQCHRSTWAQWWLEQTGEEVFDLSELKEGAR